MESFGFGVTRCCECLAAKAGLLDGFHASVVDAQNSRQVDTRAWEQSMVHNLILVYNTSRRSHHRSMFDVEKEERVPGTDVKSLCGGGFLRL